MKRLALVAAVGAAAAIFPSAAFASFSGVVVGKAPGSLAVATKSGAIHTVRTRAHPGVGTRVRVSGSTVRAIGRAHRVRIHAVIVRRAGATTFVAGGHSLLALRTGRRLSSVSDRTGTGTVIATMAQVTPSGLTAGATQVVGRLSSIRVDAIVRKVEAGRITLDVNGQMLVVDLPAGIQLPASLVGQTVTLTLNLTGGQPTASEDDNEADDNDQGDDNDDQGDDNDDQDDSGVDDGD